MNASVYLALLGLAAAGLQSIVWGPSALTVIFSISLVGLVAHRWGK